MSAAERARTIVCVDHSPRIGGATRVLLTALHALDRSAFRAVVVCNAGPVAEEFSAAGHDVVTSALPILTFAGGAGAYARMGARFLRASALIHRTARATAAVALYAHGLASALYAAQAAVIRRTPLVWHVHDLFEDRRRMRPFVRAAAGAARSIVCVSRACADRAVALGAPRDRCSVVHNALPIPLAADSGGDGDRATDAEAPLLVAAGALTPAKGHAVLVEAMAELAASYPRATAIVAGEPLQDGDRRHAERVRARIAELGLDERVRLVGFRHDLGALLRRATVVVHPSTCEESFGLVPLEAMALGRPVVASRIGGIPEVVEDGRTGLLVPPDDAKALARALRALLDDPALRERMGAEARRAVRERFAPAATLRGLNAAFARAAGIAPFVVPTAADQAPAPDRCG